MISFCDKREARFGDLAKRIRFEYDVSASRKAVFEALGHMEFLGVEDKIYVVKQLCNNTKDLDLFFSLPDDMQSVMVKIMLDGRI
ncbi:hypothetical protein Pfo_031281 [Paulownia fortunei]|nr:hypothetical protein Pfo_031281 [Paulownia fortunei]